MLAGRWEEHRRALPLLLGCMLALLWGSFRMDVWEAKDSRLFKTEGQAAEAVAEAKPQRAEVEALVTGAVWKGSYWQLTARTGGVRGEKFLVRLPAGEEDLESVCALVGRRCTFQGSVRVPDSRRNFGCFDYRLYLRGRGIFRILEVNRYRVWGGPVRNVLLNFLAVSKAQFYSRVRPFLGEESFSLLAGLLFGDKGYLDENLYSSFRSGGIAHVLAVSGLHVGLVYGALVKLMGNRRNRAATAISAAALLCYICLSNFSISVLRAAFMIALRLAAFHLHRRYDLLSAASLAAIVFLSANPYQLLDSGFQLSYMAAYSLGVAMPRLELKALELSDRYKKGWILKASNVLSPCIAVQLGMTPLTVFHFLLFSPVSLLLNPFALVLAGLLLPAGLLLYAVQALDVPLLTAAAAGPADAFARCLVWVSRAGEAFGGYWSAAAPPIGMMAVYYALFFWWFSEGRAVLLRSGRKRAAALVCASMMLASCLLPVFFGLSDSCLPWSRPCRDVVFADVGQGDAIHIRCGGVNVLMDGGGSYLKNVGEDTLLPYLLKNGVSGLELAIVSHADLDHAKGIQELSQVLPIRTIAFPEVYKDDPSITEGYRAERFVFLKRGDALDLGGAVFTVLAPFGDERAGSTSEYRNESCIAGILEFQGFRVLLTGDMTAGTEARLLAESSPDALRADVLKVAHHGSAYSTGEEFLQAVSPAIAVISCGRNNVHGHPALRVTELLEEEGIEIFRTDTMGALGVTREKDGCLEIENADGTVIIHFKGVIN